ncbi:MAG: hypothetical protein ACPGR8_10290 [Limisphaerales bacterium]
MSALNQQVLHWNVHRVPGSRKYRVLAAADLAKYAGFEEAQHKIARRLIDDVATRHADELEQLYTAVSQSADKLKVYETEFMASINAQWQQMMQTHMLLKVTDAGNESADRCTLLLAQEQRRTGAEPAQKRYAVVCGSAEDARLAHGGWYQQNNSISGTACAKRQSLQLVYSNCSTISVQTEDTDNTQARLQDTSQTLNDLLSEHGDNTVATRALLARRMVDKAQVSVKVHTVAHGARKRKNIEEDLEPYGGSAKQWEVDAADCSLNDHLHELRSVVCAAAAGLCAEHSALPGAMLAVLDSGEVIVLHRKNSALWERNRLLPTGVDWSLQLKPNNRWTLSSETVSLECQLDSSVWRPGSAKYVTGVCFVSDTVGASAVVFRPPPRRVWHEHQPARWACYEFDPLSKDAATAVWRGPPGAGRLQIVWPLAVIDTTTAEVEATIVHVAGNDVTETTVPHSRVVFHESVSSKTLTDLSDDRKHKQADGAARVASALPFQENACGDNADFTREVWAGFKTELAAQARVAVADIAPKHNAETHYLSAHCYHLRQSATQRHSSNPVVQLNNSYGKWSLGAAPFVAGDALAATLSFLAADVMSNLGSAW